MAVSLWPRSYGPQSSAVYFRSCGLLDVWLCVGSANRHLLAVHAFPAQHLRPSGVLGCWPDGLELALGFYPVSSEQHRLF